MGKLHYGGMDDATEAALVKESVTTLRKLSGQPVRGWMSPAKSESFNTLAHLKRVGIEYCCDWGNDDMPFPLKTPEGGLWAMPHSSEINDRKIIMENHHSEDEFVEQVRDQFDVLSKESEQYGGRILSIALTPHVMGLHYRVKYLDEMLGWIASQSNVWVATGAEILDAFSASMNDSVTSKAAE
jgi:peptidoglycan/xylan/chitin deacetylase (PgdA/CDA1 family)